METDLVGTLAQLPDGQSVKIEIVHDDGFATVRRIDGEWAGEIAVCKIMKLAPGEPAEPKNRPTMSHDDPLL